MDIDSLRDMYDAHVHILGDAAVVSLKEAGVRGVRDAGSRDGVGLRMAAQDTAPLAIVSAGWALYKTGGYGSRIGRPVETQADISSQISRLKEAGAAIIKVIASGLVSLTHPGTITAGGLDSRGVAVAVREAGAAGLGVMAHANGEGAIIACAEARVRSIEHGFFMTERALEAMARNRTLWVPTVGALKRAAEAMGPAPEIAAYVESVIADHLRMIRRAQVLGVPLAIGTDRVLPDPKYQEAYLTEMEFFSAAGLPSHEVLRIARDSRSCGLE